MHAAEVRVSPSITERVLSCVPILGWIIANEMSKVRLRKMFARVSSILVERAKDEDGSFHQAVLGRSPTGYACRTVIQEVQRWPSDRFYDGDEMAVLLLDADWFDIKEIVGRICSLLRKPVPDCDQCDFADLLKMTFSEFVTWIDSR
jgi:hypothetical protein